MLHKSMENLGGLSINQASIEQLSTNNAPMGSSVYFSNCSAGKPRADVSQLEVAHVRTVAESVIDKCTKNLDVEKKPRNPHRARKNLVLFSTRKSLVHVPNKTNVFAPHSQPEK